MERFAQLLEELSEELDTTLSVDQNGACLLVINDTLRVQMECNVKPHHLLIASFLCDIPPGKFRENVLKDALKANHPQPEMGTLSYSDRNNQLSLFAFLPLPSLRGKQLVEFLVPFVEKAEQWKQAVQKGTTASLVPSIPVSQGGLFGQP